MKKALFISFLFCSILVIGQEKTVSSKELDSLFNIKSSGKHRAIEHVPIYEGCDDGTSNDSLKKCMSEKVALLFKDNFNLELHKDSTLEPGVRRIVVIFKVDAKGYVTDVSARAEDRFLEAEAVRVAKLIPKLEPGHIDGTPVTVPYTIPLMVDMTANHNAENTTFPVYRGCDKTSTNEELEQCSKKKILDFMKVKFDYQMADRLFPNDQSTQIQLDFIINKKGKVEHVNVKANHKAVAIHAIRLAKQLPKFKLPGTKNGKPIDTPFSMLMTIYFQ